MPMLQSRGLRGLRSMPLAGGRIRTGDQDFFLPKPKFFPLPHVALKGHISCWDSPKAWRLQLNQNVWAEVRSRGQKREV